MAQNIKTCCQNDITYLARAQLTRSDPGSVQDWKRSSHSVEWKTIYVELGQFRNRFFEAMRNLYRHPGGSRRLREIKDILFSYLNIAGARFLTNRDLELFGEEEPEFNADVVLKLTKGPLATRLQFPGDVRYQATDCSRSRTKIVVKLQWSCESCQGFILAGPSYFDSWFTADLRQLIPGDWPRDRPAEFMGQRPVRICRDCSLAGHVPAFI